MIIGISGHKQSGKNTVALIWQLLMFESTPRYKEIVGSKYIDAVDYVLSCLHGNENYHLYSHYFTWQQKSFAYKLKQIVCILTGCTLDQLENEEFKNSPVPYTWTKSKLNITTYRELLQKLGTEVFRNNVHQDIWVDLLLQDYSADQNWLITDTRFVDEANIINENQGTLLKIIGKDQTQLSQHQSETDLDEYPLFQYYIDNNGTYEHLIKQVQLIIAKEC